MSDSFTDLTSTPWGEVGAIVAERDALRAEVDRRTDPVLAESLRRHADTADGLLAFHLRLAADMVDPERGAS